MTHTEERENEAEAGSDNEDVDLLVHGTPVPGPIAPNVLPALYAAHFLTTWGERMWEFAIGLIMLRLMPSSLTLVSAYGLVDGGMQAALSLHIGAYVDRTPRLHAALAVLTLQNVGVLASALCALLALAVPPRSVAYWVLVSAAIGAGAASSLGGMGGTISVERDWAKALAGGDADALARINAGMRRIDMVSLIASPIATGACMTYAGHIWTTAAIAAWNAAAWAPTGLLLHRVHAASPALREPKGKLETPTNTGEGGPKVAGLEAWATYARQEVVLPANALALLYLTVLSFGLLMTAYLSAGGMSEAELSLYRGVGALSGLAATFAFPWLQSRAGVVRAGLAGIWLQWACLAAAVTPTLISSAAGSASSSRAFTVHVLVVGLAASRFGLWTFDLAATQLLQERVATSELGVVNGVQGSLQSLFQTASFAAGLAAPALGHFPALMATSCLCVLLAAGLYTVFALRRPHTDLASEHPANLELQDGAGMRPRAGAPAPEGGM